MLVRSPLVLLLSHPQNWKRHGYQTVVQRLFCLSQHQALRCFATDTGSSHQSSSSSNHSSSLPSSSPAAPSGDSSSSAAATMVTVDITRDNFQEVLPAVKQALERCTFFAIDCEMTGLHTDGSKHEYLDDHQTRYCKIADSSKSFIVTQYGLSCFELTGPNTYEASTFNFFVFPSPFGNYNRKFLCDASSLEFLSKHGFDFNTCIGQGVRYMPLRTRDWQLMQVDRYREGETRQPVAAGTPEDKAFVQDLIQLVTDWLAGKSIQDSMLHMHGGLSTDEDTGMLSADENGPAAAEGAQVNGVQAQQEQLQLVPMNSFRRLLAFQELRKAQFGVQGHPGFFVTKAEGDSRCIVLVRASQQQAEAHEAQERAAKIAQIHSAAGFAAVFDAMRASNKPCVGHNCMLDISYGLFCFADSYLPATWNDYKKMVRSWHRGGIWDTKYLARRLPEVFEGDTGLSSVFATTNQPTDQQLSSMQALLQAGSADSSSPLQLPHISHAPGFDKYRNLAPGEAAHEAGYDAFMTGATFAAMLPLVAAKVAADPTHELSLAHSEALQRAAEAAQVAPGTGSAHPLPLFRCHSQLPQQPQHQPPATQQEIPAAQQQQPDGVEPQQQEATKQQQPATQQQDVDMQEQQPQQQQQQQPSLMSFVSGVVGRLNYTFSDLQYAALWGEDPIPDRPGTFHLSGLQEGYRFDEISRMMRRLGFNAARITAVDASSCLVTVKPEEAAAAAAADLGQGLLLTPWEQHAQLRYSRKLPDGLGAVDGTAAGGAGASAGAAAAAAAGAAGSSGMRRAAKRPRTAIEDEDGGEEQQQRSYCSIM